MIEYITAYRVCNSNFAKPHNGYGSTLRDGGRWNSKKYPCIYTGSNRSIAQLEWVSHALLSAVDFPPVVMVTYQLPKGSISHIDISKYPFWLIDPLITKKLGDEFLSRKKYLALAVPSTMDVKEINYIINPFHPDFTEPDNLIQDNEPLTLNKRFYEIKEFVKKALYTKTPSIAGKFAKLTSDKTDSADIRHKLKRNPIHPKNKEL